MSARADTAPVWCAEVAATRLLAWRGEELGMLARKLDAVLRAWASDWGIPMELCIGVACSPAESAGEPVAWEDLGGPECLAAWAWSTGDHRAQLAGALFRGRPQVTPLIGEIADACWSDALSRLRSLLPAGPGGCARPCAPALSAWSGAVTVSLPFDSRLLLSADAVQKLVAAAEKGPAEEGPAGPPGPLLGIADAIGDRALAIEVHLEGCDIEIGTLQDLQVGDVLRLRQGLDQPASVSVADGAPLFSGFLVRSRGRKAIELACVSS